MPASSPRAARLDADQAVGIGEGLGSGRGPDQVDVGRAEGPGDAAADDDDLGAEDVDQAAEPEPEVVRGPVDLLEGDRGPWRRRPRRGRRS